MGGGRGGHEPSRSGVEGLSQAAFCCTSTFLPLFEVFFRCRTFPLLKNDRFLGKKRGCQDALGWMKPALVVLNDEIFCFVLFSFSFFFFFTFILKEYCCSLLRLLPVALPSSPPLIVGSVGYGARSLSSSRLGRTPAIVLTEPRQPQRQHSALYL